MMQYMMMYVYDAVYEHTYVCTGSPQLICNIAPDQEGSNAMFSLVDTPIFE